jgi:hypothetical protein
MQRLLRLVDDEGGSARRATLLRRSVGLFGLLLLAATWPLWTPQTVFPQVPWVGALVSVPGWVDWVGTACLVAGLFGMLAAPEGRWARASLVLFAIAAGGLILLDQQRLQPWAYQFVLVALVLAAAPARPALAWVRLLVISSYFYSAITKLDYAFAHTLGQQFLAALAGIVGASIEGWNAEVRVAAALAFPLAELAVGIALLFTRTRRFGLAGAIAVHLLLLVILGPWGLDHRAGVLIWNAYFIVQDVLLFARLQPAAVGQAADVQATAERAPRPIAGLMLAALLLPALAPWSWFDLWPSWGLYAAGAQRVVLQIHRRAESELPPRLRAFVETPRDDTEPWLTLRIDRWALESLGAPIYPQNRLQLGAAMAVVAGLNLDHRASVTRFALADRFSGQREHDVLSGLVQCEAAADEYWLNARPRRNPLPW